MRKKSHIALAKGVIRGLDANDVIGHRFFFYVGSIWPDCTPSFLTKRHCVEETLDIWNKRMEKFVKKFNPEKNMNLFSAWRLGIVLHYVADYFTFPHNSNYPGSLKDHCVYEEELKHRMRSYVREFNPDSLKKLVFALGDIKELKEFIMDKHSKYKLENGDVDTDCRYSVLACMTVVATLFGIAGEERCAVAA